MLIEQIGRLVQQPVPVGLDRGVQTGVARKVGITRVIYPPAAGNASGDGPPRIQRAGGAAPPTPTDTREEAAPPVSRDPNDPGPPRLKRGGVADPSRERAPNVPEQDAAPPQAPLVTPWGAWR